MKNAVAGLAMLAFCCADPFPHEPPPLSEQRQLPSPTLYDAALRPVERPRVAILATHAGAGVVQFDVCNSSPDELTIEEEMLPWHLLSFGRLIAIKGDGTVTKPDRLTIIDPWPGQEVRLAPRECVSGNADMELLYAGLEQDLQEEGPRPVR